MAAFAIAGQVYTAQLTGEGEVPRQAIAQSPAIDPRPDPGGRRVAYVCDRALRISDLHSGIDVELIGPDDAEHVSYGLAEFVAAEEMGRMRGYWWAPDGTALLVARADNSAVTRWHIADPANPDRRPAEVSYPAAGTPNALVELLILSLDGRSVPVRWDSMAYPYLTTVSWDSSGAPLIVVQSRDQRRMLLLSVDPQTGAASVLRDDSDARWLDIVPGVPARLADGRIAWTADSDGARRLLVAQERELADGAAKPVTPPDMQVRRVLSGDGDTVLLSASDGDSAEIGVWAYGPDGLRMGSVAGGGHGAVRRGGTTVLTSRSTAGPGLTATILRDQSSDAEQAASEQGGRERGASQQGGRERGTSEQGARDQARA